jgi:hypothetical protein
MSTLSTTKKIRSFLAVGTVILSLAMSTGQLTAAGLVKSASPAQPDGAVELGQPALTQTTIYADKEPTVFARAAAVRDAFGFPVGTNRTGKHVRDGVQKSEYDEIAEIDKAGRQVSMAQFDAAGELVTAIRFDMPPGLAAKTTGDAAAKAAERALAKAGLSPAGEVQVDGNSLAAGWDVHWARNEDGVAVRGDETRVRVWSDGRIQSVAHVEHGLAPAPEARLSREAGRRAASAQMDNWFAGRGFGYAIQSMDMEWVGPNATFDPSKLGASAEPYRLAWVANVKPSGTISDVVRLITLYVDAGDGRLIGGDVVE